MRLASARPENITFLVTTRCDSACRYCYQRNLSRKIDAQLHSILGIVKALLPKSVTISGGEPLLLDGIFDLLLEVSSHTETMFLYTNINRLDLRDLPPELRTRLRLVVGWHVPKTQLLKVRDLLGDGWHVSVGIVGTRENIEGELLEQIPKGLRSIFLYYPTPIPRRVEPYGPDEWQDLLATAIDRLCHASDEIFVEPAFVLPEDAIVDVTCPAWQQLVFDPELRAIPCCLALENTVTTPTGTGCPVLAGVWGGVDPRCTYAGDWVPACPLLVTAFDGGLPRFPSESESQPSTRARSPSDRSSRLDLRRGILPQQPDSQVVAAVVASLDQVNLYPGSVEPLERRVATGLGVSPERVVVTQSADGAIDLLARALPGPGAVFTPTFSQYRAALARNGYECRAIPRSHIAGFTSLDPGERTLWLASPNNPSGTTVEHVLLAKMATQILSDQHLVVDETLVEFGAESLLHSHRDCDNIAWIRSFSKAFGLSGLRIGYVVASEPLAAELRRLRLPYPVSAPALAAADQSLQQIERFSEIWRQVRGHVADLRLFLTGLGFIVPHSEANFVSVFFDSPEVAARFRFLLWQQAKISVLGEDSEEYDTRGFSGGFARICLPSFDDIPQLRGFLKTAAECLSGATR